MVDGQPPKVEIIDARTIKFTWDKPDPDFIESQALAAPLFLFRPAHYLKKFHAKYASPEDIAKAAKGGQTAGNWVQIYRRHDVMYANDNPDLPTLNPWVNTTASPAQRYVFGRNPDHHRIDGKGQQLPYIDRVIFTQAATNLVPAKAGLGEADLQPRYLNMRDYTFLQKSAKSWASTSGFGNGLGPAARALAQPQRQRRGVAQADARRALPPRAVAGHRPQRAERGRLYRPGQAVEQHDHGALGPVQAGVCKEVGAVRSQARQPASRRGRPEQEGRPGLPPAARRTAGHHRGRACQRGDRGRRRAAPDRRNVEKGRHQDADQAADARKLPPARLLRRGDHDGLSPAS